MTGRAAGVNNTSVLQPVYFFAFMAVGVSMPFLPPYLRGLGFSGRQLATVLAIVPLLNMGVPLFWAWVADRTHRHPRVLSVVCLGAALGVVPVGLARRFPSLLGAYFAFASFSVGIGALIDSVAIARVRGGGGHYGRIRIWGSAGYILASVGVGVWLTERGDRPGDPLVPALMAASYLGAFAASLQLGGTGEAARRPRWRDVGALIGDRRFRLLLTIAPLHWIGCAPYNVFFGIFVRDRGLSPAVLGLALGTGVLAEMIVLLEFTRLQSRFALERLLAVAFAGTALRWALMPLCAHGGAIIALQSLHGLTFGLYWGAGIALVGACVPAHLRATGQSLFVIAMLGVGNVVGYLATGVLYDAVGTVSPAFLAAAALEMIPLALVIGAARERRAPTRAPSEPVR